MKKILFLFVMLLSVSVMMGNETLKKNVGLTSFEATKVNGSIIFARVTVSASDISLPFTITVPAPNETVIGISGPEKPNQNWKINNGSLTITYTSPTEIMGLEDGGTFFIEVATNPMKYYVIELTVN